MPRLRDRWYAYVPGIILFLGGLPLVLFSFVIRFIDGLPLAFDIKVNLVLQFSSIAVVVTTASVCCFLGWASWITPWMDAGNLRLRFKKMSPRKWWEWTRILIWMPSWFSASLGFTTAFLLPVYDWLTTGNWLWDMQQVWGMAGMVLAGVIGVWCYWYEPRVKRRLCHTLKARRLCFACGYNLRGRRGAQHCPECGHALSWDERHLAMPKCSGEAVR